MRLEVVTPTGLIVDEAKVDGVTAPGHLGEFEARPGHQPYLVRLVPGRLSHGNKRYAISGGTAEVRADHVIVLCRTDIDTARAAEALKRAQARLAGKVAKEEQVDVARAQAAVARALARLGLAKS